jgi:hypothetical protein
MKTADTICCKEYYMIKHFNFLGAAAAVCLLTSCASGSPKAVTSKPESVENSRGLLKVTKKSYEVDIRKSSVAVKVYNNLENVTYDVKPEENRVIITGTAGEEWLAKVDKVLSTYRKLDGSSLTEADIPVDKKLRVKTLPGSEYFAVFVPKERQFKVQTSWGDILTINRDGIPHGDGDYLICSVKDGNPNFSDVWVINGVIFSKTYELMK